MAGFSYPVLGQLLTGCQKPKSIITLARTLLTLLPVRMARQCSSTAAIAGLPELRLGVDHDVLSVELGVYLALIKASKFGTTLASR